MRQLPFADTRLELAGREIFHALKREAEEGTASLGRTAFCSRPGRKRHDPEAVVSRMWNDGARVVDGLAGTGTGRSRAIHGGWFGRGGRPSPARPLLKRRGVSAVPRSGAAVHRPETPVDPGRQGGELLRPVRRRQRRTKKPDVFAALRRIRPARCSSEILQDSALLQRPRREYAAGRKRRQLHSILEAHRYRPRPPFLAESERQTVRHEPARRCRGHQRALYADAVADLQCEHELPEPDRPTAVRRQLYVWHQPGFFQSE